MVSGQDGDLLNALRPTQPAFGRRLREFRLAAGLSQREVAGKAMTASYVSLLESGTRQPALEVVLHLARTLRVSPEELVGENHRSPGRADDQPARLLNLILSRSAEVGGDLKSAAEYLRAMYEHARAEGSPRQAIEAGLDLHDVLFAADDLAARYALTGELLDLADQVGAPEIRAKVMLDRASAARDHGNLDEARAGVTQAADLIHGSTLAGTSEHVRLLGVQLAILCEAGEFNEVPSLIDELLARAEDCGRGVRGRAHWAAAAALVRLGRHTEAVTELERARTELASLNITLGEWLRFCRSAASLCIEARENLDLARWYIDRAISALALAEVPAERVAVAAVRARLALAAGNPDEAAAECRVLLSSEAMVEPYERARLEGTWARALKDLGRRREAADHFRNAAMILEECGALRQALGLWRDFAACSPGADE